MYIYCMYIYIYMLCICIHIHTYVYAPSHEHIFKSILQLSTLLLCAEAATLEPGTAPPYLAAAQRHEISAPPGGLESGGKQPNSPTDTVF